MKNSSRKIHEFKTGHHGWFGFQLFLAPILVLFWASISSATLTFAVTNLPAWAHPIVNGTTSVTYYIGQADPMGACSTAANINADGSCNSCNGIVNLNPGLGGAAALPAPAASATSAYCNQNSALDTTILNVSVSSSATGYLSTAAISVSITTATSNTGTILTYATPALVTTGVGSNAFINVPIPMSVICQGITPGGNCKSAIATGQITVNVAFSADGNFTTTATGCGSTTTGTTTTTPTVCSGILDTGSFPLFYRNMDAEVSATPPVPSSNCSVATAGTAADGVCAFDILEGDEKVYLDGINFGASWPAISGSSTGVTWAGMVVVYRAATNSTYDPTGATATVISAADWSSMSLVPDDASATFISGTIPITNAKLIGQSIVDGLDNDTLYAFSIGSVDQAGNISDFSPVTDTNFTNSTSGTFGYHYGVPGPVVGLLTGKKCFIATAAFGSPMEKHVQVLRNFRDHFLLNSSWGRDFVRTYYHFSPPMAQFIHRHDNLRWITRGLLWPLIAVAEVFDRYGAIVGLAVSLMSLLIVFLIFRLLLKSISIFVTEKIRSRFLRRTS